MAVISPLTAKASHVSPTPAPTAAVSLPVAVTASPSAIPLELLKQYSSSKPILVQPFSAFKRKAK